MAAARLTGAASVLVAAWMVATLPLRGEASGLVALVGWAGVALLGGGLVIGYRSGVSAATVALVLHWALASLQGRLGSPVAWILLMVLTVELADASFTFRLHRLDPWATTARALLVSVGAAFGYATLAWVESAQQAGGILVRAAGVGALVVAAGWVTRMWRRSAVTG